MDDDLEIFISAESIKALSIDETTERQVQQCVEEMCNHKEQGEQLYLIKQTVNGH